MNSFETCLASLLSLGDAMKLLNSLTSNDSHSHSEINWTFQKGTLETFSNYCDSFENRLRTFLRVHYQSMTSEKASEMCDYFSKSIFSYLKEKNPKPQKNIAELIEIIADWQNELKQYDLSKSTLLYSIQYSPFITISEFLKNSSAISKLGIFQIRQLNYIQSSTPVSELIQSITCSFQKSTTAATPEDLMTFYRRFYNSACSEFFVRTKIDPQCVYDYLLSILDAHESLITTSKSNSQSMINQSVHILIEKAKLMHLLIIPQVTAQTQQNQQQQNSKENVLNQSLVLIQRAISSILLCGIENKKSTTTDSILSQTIESIRQFSDLNKLISDPQVGTYLVSSFAWMTCISLECCGFSIPFSQIDSAFLLAFELTSKWIQSHVKNVKSNPQQSSSMLTTLSKFLFFFLLNSFLIYFFLKQK